MGVESGHEVVRRLYKAVGSPPYQEIRAAAQLIGHDLGIGTISNLLTGKTEPRRRTVLAFVQACFSRGVRAKRLALFGAMPPGTDNAEHWMALWDAATGKRPTAPNVASWDFFVVCRNADALVAQHLTELLRPRARVCGNTVLLPGTSDHVIDRHHRSSRVTVMLLSSPAAEEIRDHVATGVELARRDPDGHLMVPVLLEPVAEMPAGLSAGHAIADATPLHVVAGRLLDALASLLAHRALGPSELAEATVSLLTSVDDHLTGQPSPHGSTIEALLTEFDDPAFSARARRNGLQPALLLRGTADHLVAVRQWCREDDGTAVIALDRFRDHLADAIAAGRFALPAAVAAQVAENVRGERTDQWEVLSRFTGPVRSTSKEAVLAEHAELDVVSGNLDARGRRLLPVARQMCVLPPADQRFCGRDELLDALPKPGVLWLSGAPGTGTSAVAVHWAHRVADTFETVLYLDLFGMTPESRRPARTAARILLVALGEQIVSDMREDAALYERLAAALRRTRSLLVLDNARDADHVAPIVRAGGPQVTVITSRQRVQPFTEDVVHIPVLDRRASIRLLAGYDPGAGEQVLDRIAELCDDLSLALRLTAVRLGRPDLPADELARLLAAEHTRLDFMEAGDRAVRAAIVVSYKDLKPHARRAARYLSIGFGSVSDAAEMAAGLADDEARISLALHRVVDASLADYACGAGGSMRFRFAPLVRLAMSERSAKEDTETEVSEFRRRVARYLADQLTGIVGRTGGDPVLEVDPTRAHAALTAAVAGEWWDTAVDLGRDLRAMHQTDFDLAGVDVTTTALVTAYLALGEPEKAAKAATEAAAGLRASDQHRQSALRWARQGVDLARTHDVAKQKVRSCLLCSSIATDLGDTDTALTYAQLAVELSDPGPNSPEAIRPLINVGKLLVHVGKPKKALAALQRATDLADRIGGPADRAAAHFQLAAAVANLGRRKDAMAEYARATTFFAAADQPFNAAIAKDNEAGLGIGDEAVTAMKDAVAHWRTAREPAWALTALCRLAGLVLLTTGSPADALQILDEADDLLKGQPDLVYEVAMRKACLRGLLGQPAQPPEGDPPARLAGVPAYQNATTALVRGNSQAALQMLVLHPVVAQPEAPKLWVFDDHGTHARPSELD